MKNKMFQRVLSSTLAVLVAAGTLSVLPAKVADAASNLVMNGGFETGSLSQGYVYACDSEKTAEVVNTLAHAGTYSAKVEKTKLFQFTADGVNGATTIPAGDDYAFSAWIYAEQETVINLSIPSWDKDWGNNVNAGNITYSVKAKEWTKITYTCTSADYERILQPRVWSDTVDFYIDDIMIKKANQEDLALTFSKLDDAGNWMFNRSDIGSDFLGYYKADFYVDGAKQSLWMELVGNETYIYPGVFSATPENELRLSKGTVLKQYDPNEGKFVDGGKELTLTDTLYVVKGENGWDNATYEAKAGLQFEKYATDGTFWLKSDYPADFGGNGSEGKYVYYRATILVDDIEQPVWFEFIDGYGYLYPHLFTIKPSESVEIKAGTVLTEAAAKGAVVDNARTVTIKDNLKLVYDESRGWYTPCTLQYVEEVAATCTKDGVKEHWACTDADCGKVFADAAGSNETTREALVIKSEGHKYTDTVTKADFKNDAKKISKCACGDVVETVIASKISTVTVSDKTYNGKNQSVSIVVKDSKKKVIPASAYTLSGTTKAKKAGSYKVTVKFKGNYTGTKTLTWKILPKSTSLNKVTAGKKKATVTWKKQTAGNTGYKIQISTDKNFKKSVKTYTVKKTKTTSYTAKNLKAKKTYYVRICTYNGKVQSSWSKVKSVKIKK